MFSWCSQGGVEFPTGGIQHYADQERGYELVVVGFVNKFPVEVTPNVELALVWPHADAPKYLTNFIETSG
jgi:hypothetical protein